MKLFLKIICVLLLFPFEILSFINTKHLSPKRKNEVPVFFMLDEKQMVQNSEIILVAPVMSVSAQQFTALIIPDQIKSSIITKNNLISYIDGTPFCTMADYITSSNFCIFVKETDIEFIDQFLSWVKKVKPNNNYNEQISGFLLCKKTNILKLKPSKEVVN